MKSIHAICLLVCAIVLALVWGNQVHAEVKQVCHFVPVTTCTGDPEDPLGGDCETHDEQECEFVVVDGGGIGSENPPPPPGGPGGPTTGGTCEDKAAQKQQQCVNSALSGQSDCQNQNISIGRNYCTTQVTPVSVNDIQEGDSNWNAFAGTVCVSPPSAFHGPISTLNSRVQAWIDQCRRDIATFETANERQQCLDQLIEGGGAYFDKFKLSASSKELKGEISGTIDQGITKGCFDEANKNLAACRQQKRCDDAACQSRHLSDCKNNASE